MNFSNVVLGSMLATLVARTVLAWADRLTSAEVEDEDELEYSRTAQFRLEEGPGNYAKAIDYAVEFNDEEGNPSQDVVFVGDCPYLLIRCSEDGTETFIRAGGFDMEYEQWLLSDIQESIGIVADQKALLESGEDDDYYEDGEV